VKGAFGGFPTEKYRAKEVRQHEHHERDAHHVGDPGPGHTIVPRKNYSRDHGERQSEVQPPKDASPNLPSQPAPTSAAPSAAVAR
jgi:hypothetical protein